MDSFLLRSSYHIWHNRAQRAVIAFTGIILLLGMTSCSQNPHARYQLLMDSVCTAEKFPGMVLLVDHSYGEVWKGAAGYSSIENKTRMTTGALFQIGSVTKLITAVAILQLVDSNKIDIHAHVTEILDSSIIGRIPYIQEITIDQLLNHTSGIYGTNNNYEYINSLIGTGAGNKRIWKPEELIALTWEGKNEPFGKPGQGTWYGDVNYILLGLIVQKASGMPLKEYVRKNILKKLGMKSTVYLTDFTDFEREKPKETADEYMVLSKEIRDFIRVNEKFPRLNDSLMNTSAAPEQIDAAGGILSNVNDLWILGDAVFRGNFLSEKSMNLLYEFSSGIEKQKVNASKQGPLRVVKKDYGVLFMAEGDGPGGGNTLLAYHPVTGTIIVGHINIFGLWTEKESIADRIIPVVIK
jgi:D-alanyl-D-alanine carboxypeptidase